MNLLSRLINRSGLRISHSKVFRSGKIRFKEFPVIFTVLSFELKGTVIRVVKYYLALCKRNTLYLINSVEDVEIYLDLRMFNSDNFNVFLQ